MIVVLWILLCVIFFCSNRIEVREKIQHINEKEKDKQSDWTNSTQMYIYIMFTKYNGTKLQVK